MLATSVFAVLCLLQPAQDLDPRWEDRHLATIPEGLSLDGPPITHPQLGTIEVKSPIHWSPDGRRVAYVAFRGEQRHAVVGDHVSEPHEYLSSVSFGDRGEDVVFRAGDKTSKSKEKWFLYRGPDHKKKPKTLDWMGAPAMAPDGSRVIVWSQPGAKIGKDGYYVPKAFEIYGAWKRKSEKWDDGTCLSAPRFSADSARAFTAALDDGVWSILCIDKKGQRKLVTDLISVQDYAAMPGTETVAVTTLLMATRDIRGNVEEGPDLPEGVFGGFPGLSTARVRMDGVDIGAAYDASFACAFSQDGSALAFKILHKGKMGVAAGNGSDAVAAWDHVTRPVVSPNGQYVAFAGNLGTTLSFAQRTRGDADFQDRGGKDQVHVFAVKDQAKCNPVGDAAERIEYIRFLSDGDRVAFAAKSSDGWRVHCGSAVSDAYDEIGPLHIHAEGMTIGFGARKDRELLWRTLAVSQ